MQGPNLHPIERLLRGGDTEHNAALGPIFEHAYDHVSGLSSTVDDDSGGNVHANIGIETVCKNTISDRLWSDFLRDPFAAVIAKAPIERSVQENSFVYKFLCSCDPLRHYAETSGGAANLRYVARSVYMRWYSEEGETVMNIDSDSDEMLVVYRGEVKLLGRHRISGGGNGTPPKYAKKLIEIASFHKGEVLDSAKDRRQCKAVTVKPGTGKHKFESVVTYGGGDNSRIETRT